MRWVKVFASARKVSVIAAVLVAMTLLVLWLSGVFGPKVPATTTPARLAATLPAGVPTVTLAAVDVRVRDEAVGSVRAVHEVQLASRLLGRVAAVHVRTAGQSVAEGDVLVELESDDLRANVLEAEAAAESAQQTLEQRERDLERTRELFAREIAASRDLERDQTAVDNARAEVERRRQVASAATTMLEWATIRSPITGIVVDKLVQPGDTVTPGQVLMRLYDPDRMQLVASVREQLADRLQPGQQVEVAIDAVPGTCHGVVAEIVPQSSEGARAFEVKVTGPCPPGVFSGMFGRVFVDLGVRSELRVPRAAVREIGQIDQVQVVGAGGALSRRFVVLGRPVGDQVPVLSGLREGEVIVADAAALAAALRR